MSDLETAVRQSITDALTLENLIDLDTRLDLLEIDSMDVVLMAQELEDRLGCSIDISALSKLKTPAEVVAFIQEIESGR